ncbi:hypothetical protein KACHI17_10140 [Sediminibacterium sp. KACHI17]|jgi:hypothetical protein|uniref:Uncharacterized protein n=1 Tax=Sediminibacterium sp. KACHI17 TaxID=1751071 RepID=A0AAT9GHX9_9BACT
MRPLLGLLLFFLGAATVQAQDTTVRIDNQSFTLAEVVVRNNFDYRRLLNQIKEDTTFYKAFRNLRILGFTSYNDIKMLNRKGGVEASLYSKTRQNRANGCRTMDVLEEKTTGDFYDRKGEYNYETPELYAGLFFTKGTVCGEDNIVKGRTRNVSNKKGMEKHKEQLKMLFFNPGKKIPGIPLIGNKLDLYDDDAHKLYDYRLDLEEYKGQLCYVFSITPKENLGFLKNDRVVVDQMTTWFDQKTLEVMGRNYSLSYKALVYDFDVQMEVEMGKFQGLTVPKILRYKGNWDVAFKKRERAVFTATLFDFKK